MSAANVKTPLQQQVKEIEKDGIQQAKDVEEEGIRGYGIQQVKEVEEVGIHAYLGSFICCRVLAPISVPFLEENRHQVLHICQGLCAVALFFSIVSFWGAFAHTTTLARLSWVTVHSPNGVAHAGVKWICYDLPSAPPDGTFGQAQISVETGDGSFWKCKTWQEFNCSESPEETACQMCQNEANAIICSVLFAVGAFYSFYQKTRERLNGQDSNFTKFMACFAALISGTNFFLAILSYASSCVLHSANSDVHVHAGPGLICMVVAALLKVLGGVVHLCLPVESYKHES